MKDLTTWLKYFEELHPTKIDLSLERVRKVADRLNLRSIDSTVITVGGTNGKGSSVGLLESMYLSAGYKVGAYISPHILRYNERIRINGVYATDEQIISAFIQIESARQDISLTYYEVTTLAALYLFKLGKLDIYVLEIGLGGRLDAINIMNPDIAIITSLSFDHTKWLGETLEAIGYEKAGIFRPHKPAICAVPNPPQSVLQYASDLQSSLKLLERDYFYIESENSWSWYSETHQQKRLPLPKIDTINAATVLMVMHQLMEQLPVQTPIIHTVLREFSVVGRYQSIYLKQKQVTLILDVAHNLESTQNLAKKLTRDFISGKTWALVGILADKAIESMLHSMNPVIHHWVITNLPTERAASSEVLYNYLKQLKPPSVQKKTTIDCAMQYIFDNIDTGDRIVVFGSFYTVAGVLEYGMRQYGGLENAV